MRHDVSEWESVSPPTLDLEFTDIERFAPNTLSFMEFKDPRDLELTEKIYAEHPILGELMPRLGGSYSQEFNMTSDSKHFTKRKVLEQERLLLPEEDTRDPRVRARLRVAGFLPLYEGKCFWLHDPYFNSPDLFIEIERLNHEKDESVWTRPRMSTRNVASSTNQRTLATGILPATGHGNSCPSLDGLPTDEAFRLMGILSTLPLDYVLRMKISVNLNWFYLETLPIADGRSSPFDEVGRGLVRLLNCLGADFPEPASEPLVDPGDRFAARLVLEALVADIYGLHPDDLAHIATRFPIYDRDAPDDYRFANAAVEVFGAMHSDGLDAAERTAKRLAEERQRIGCGFSLDEIYVPDGGWVRANQEALEILGGS